MLKAYGIYREENHNKSDLIYRFQETGAEVMFGGLDSLTGVKSQKSAEYHDIWVNEANEIDRPDWLFLKTRLYRGVLPVVNVGKKAYPYIPQLRFDLNPEECWIQGLEDEADDKEVQFFRSSYKDNPFMNPEAVAVLEGLKDQDAALYEMYALGKWSKRKGVIFGHVKLIDKMPDKFEEDCFGLDRGYNHPTSVVYVRKTGNTVYIDNLIYQSRLTTGELIDMLKERIPEERRGRPIYCPPEEPELIDELNRSGFRAKAANNEVLPGIDTLKRYEVYSLTSNTELNKEFRSYSWKYDPRTDTFLDSPVKWQDDGVDSARYAVHSQWPKHKQAIKRFVAGDESGIVHGETAKQTFWLDEV
jgi:PBSX family phage terminase large subunit